MLTLVCQQLDAADVAAMKQRFALPDNTIYLDGNSLGARPKTANARAQAVVEQEWEQRFNQQLEHQQLVEFVFGHRQ